MHDVAFGLDPHFSHVALFEQQQPIPGDVVLFEQVGVNLHAQRALPWEGARQTSHRAQKKKKLPDQFYTWKKFYLHRIFAASRNTKEEKMNAVSFSSNISNLYVHVGGVRGHWPHPPPSKWRCSGWAAAVHKWQSRVKHTPKQKSSLLVSGRSQRGHAEISVCRTEISEEKKLSGGQSAEPIQHHL